MCIKRIIARIRFEFMRLFMPDYIMQSIKNRKGECMRCGICCGECEYYKGRECIVYNERMEIMKCRVFPIDQRDKMLVNKNCGYWW